jgi:hypothetical protein
MRRPLLLGFDDASVVAFVAIGRDTHDEGNTLGGLVETAAPFLIGAAAGWLVTRAWRHPTSLPTGVGVAATTVVVGMLTRRFVFDAGTAASFIVVASIFLGLSMVGWRVVAQRIAQGRRAGLEA